ncbi:erythromycin esterase family protein [Halorientalis salina]|uniref:erythromycin esterase family protein n=1 Tax=Halorientalis salina TaxID=2932266 RepID=UPI0010AD205D|nr:erythromycin esterase family protein [Halorientalis salina]
MGSIFGRDDPETRSVNAAIEAVNRHARPLDDEQVRRLADRLCDRQVVCIGEASHGTSEFYRLRARLTAALIEELDDAFVAVEGDWTDCYEVNRFVRGLSDHEDGRSVLAEFDRWPTWMWANWEVRAFVEWLRAANARRDDDSEVGFYGMDVYSLFESMAAVVDYLEDTDPEAAQRARNAYHCFEPYEKDARAYARSTRLVPEDCEDEVLSVLSELREDRPRHDNDHPDAWFNAEQNAVVAANAESYYRAMVRGDVSSWNVRDRHMAETLDRLRDHHDDATAIVWAHNTHVGDARATSMAERGEVTVGQLVREAYGRDDVALVGFGTHHGSVIAGRSWGAPMEQMRVPPAQEGSYEHVLRRADPTSCLLESEEIRETALSDTRGHRAIGVVYHPDRELGNYVSTDLPDRYDAFLYVEETEALQPFDVEADERETPEAYPWGL